MHFVSLVIRVIGTVGMVLDGSRLLTSLTIRSGISTSNVAHVALLARAYGPVARERGHTSFPVEAPDLQLAKLDVEVGDEVLEDVAAFGHELGRLFVRQDLLDVLFRLLEVGEEQDEDLPWVARDLYQVHRVIDLVEVTVEDLPTHFDSRFVKADSHRRRSLLCDDIDLVGSLRAHFFV